MDKTGQLNYIELGIDDMTNLVELSDESLLYNLQTRYDQKIIYTYIGSILISINPYTELNIYDKKHIHRYQNKSMQEVPPHLFGIAEINYSKMMMENENQVIVISGESGAGKTEGFKRLLRYLAFTSGGVKELKSSDRELSNDIADKILDSTPLLESFGNAKTIRNDNSSRFGKFVEIFFDNGTICGSRTTNYLLEKSRIVKINPDERGYHIFYELLQGLDSFGKSQYYLKNVADYAYLNNAKNFEVKGRDDAANLKEFMNQWSTLGMTNDDLDVALRIISAVLHLGNIKFGEEENASYLLEKENVNVVAKMLKVDCASLISCLTMKTTDTVKDIASSPVNAEQAGNLRDTLAKHLYSELFDWIVAKVNESLNQKTVLLKRTSSHLDRSLNSSSSKTRCIAMLDIYGFENFPENSLEQLCINYANETLQQFFNRYVFELEQAEYKQEGISWHYVTYPDNQPIINLLAAKPSGIIQILNDECSIPQGSDEAFLTKCDNVHKKNENFEKPKKVFPPQFIIRHFAGNIFYNVTGFLDKNRDIIRKDAIRLIEHCGNEEIAVMFRKKKERTIKNPNIKARTPAVMADFQNSLLTLLNKMKQCQPWFIRCLKPNKKKEPLSFDKDMVMDQMRYTGILETVKIRKSGFPIRIIFNTFLSRFYLLQSKDMRRFARTEPQQACLNMLPKFGGQRGKEFEVGKTKLFFKETFARHLESQVRIIREKSAIKIQRQWRAYWEIRKIIIRNRAATKLQAIARGFIIRRRIKRFHVAIVKLQAFVRMQLVRQKFMEAHPEFLKYSFNKIDDNSLTTATTYKFSAMKSKDKSKPIRDKKVSPKFNYNLLKIPMKLAFLLEKSTGNYGDGHGIPRPGSIIQTGRAQHLYNRDEYQLPSDINDYQIEDFIGAFGNNFTLESKARPIQNPFLIDNMSPIFKDDSLNAHKLLLRLIYVNSMPWLHQYLAGSFLSHMASTSPQMQMEILIQIIAETIYDGPMNGKRHMLNEVDTKRLSRAWALLGNLLGHIILVPQIFNYVLKYVSTSFGVDQACTCQEKLLQFVNDRGLKVPRLFPSSNLEWRANIRGAKTSLKTVHADDVHNSVHVTSFTTAEIFANHSLCFRFRKFRVNQGWSISVVTSDTVIDCSGHNYILDVIAGLELPSNWADIVGYGIENKFLISKFGNVNGSNTVNSRYIRSQLFNEKIKSTDGYDNKSMDTIASRKSMDSWVDRYFDKSFKGEEAPNVRVHDFIHGLEDDLKVQQNKVPQPGIEYQINPVMTSSIPTGIPGIETQSQNNYQTSLSNTTLLEEQLRAAEIQNKLYQTSIENELLQKRLMDLRQQSSIQASVSQSYPQTSSQPNQSYNQGHIHFENGNDQRDSIPQSNNPVHTNRAFDRHNHPSSSSSYIEPQRTEQDKITNIKKRRSIVKYSEVAPPSEIVVDDSTVLPELKKKQSVTLSQLRAAEIPKVNVANRAAFLDQFFLDKKIQSPDTSKVGVKRKAPIVLLESVSHLPINELAVVPKPQPRSNIEHIAPLHPLIYQEKIIPRPSIYPDQSLSEQDDAASSHDRMDFQDHHFTITESLNSDYEQPVKIQTPEIKKRRKRIISSDKNAIILSGLSDIHHNTYTNVPWFLMVKIELFLPKEIRELTILGPIIFCQIVRDLTEFPCIRWIGTEKMDLLSMISNKVDRTNIKSLLSTPSNVMLNVIDRVQNCELYFSRFYSIQWSSTNTSGQVSHWLAISHSGIRFVEQDLLKPESELKIVCRIPYKDLRTITCEDADIYNNPQQIRIKTRSNKNYEILSPHAISAMDLVHEFVRYQEEANKLESLSSSRENAQSLSQMPMHKKKFRKGLESDELFMTNVTTFDVNKRRIPMKNFLDNSEYVKDDNAIRPSTAEKFGDLIDFMISYSKYKSKEELSDVVLRWQSECIHEPLLPTLNNSLTKRAIELFNLILILSGETAIEPSLTLIDCGVTIFQMITRSRELMEEVVLQIIKQINGNDKTHNRQMLWNLLFTIAIFFGVTKRMEPYLMQHLKDISSNQSNPDQNSIKYTLKVLQKTLLHGLRKEMPLDNELRFLLDGVKDAKMTVYIPRDAIHCSIRFNNTVGEVIKNICRTIDVSVEHEIAEYSLAIVEVNEQNEPINAEEYLEDNLYLFDIINSLARNKKSNSIFYFSRGTWTFPILPMHTSDRFINFTFNQLSKEVICEKWMIYKANNPKLLSSLASIAYFSLKGQGYDKPIHEHVLTMVFPNEITESVSNSELINMINSIANTIETSKMTGQVDYQRKFIDLVLQLPFFGWIKFPINRFSHLPSANNLTINFTPANISVYNESTCEKIMKIPLSTFHSFQSTKMDSGTSHFILRYNGKHEIQFISGNLSKLVFLLNQCKKIRNLIPNRRSKDA